MWIAQSVALLIHVLIVKIVHTFFVLFSCHLPRACPSKVALETQIIKRFHVLCSPRWCRHCDKDFLINRLIYVCYASSLQRRVSENRNRSSQRPSPTQILWEGCLPPWRKHAHSLKSHSQDPELFDNYCPVINILFLDNTIKGVSLCTQVVQFCAESTWHCWHQTANPYSLPQYFPPFNPGLPFPRKIQ